MKVKLLMLTSTVVLQALASDVLAHKSRVDAVKLKTSSVIDPSAAGVVSASVLRYDALAAAVAAKQVSLESSLSAHEQFHDAYRSCTDAMSSEQQRLKKVAGSVHDGSETVEQQTSQLDVSEVYFYCSISAFSNDKYSYFSVCW
jgi:exonuclease VII small subunit